MNRVFIVAALSVGLTSVSLGCSSSSTTPSGTSSSSSSSSSGSTGDVCAIPPATYTIHYTKAGDAGATCADIPDATVDVEVSDASTSDGQGNGCSQTEDSSSCTFTLTCTSSAAGSTTTSVSEIKNASGSVSGTEHVTATDSTGATTYDCTYDFVYQKD